MEKNFKKDKIHIIAEKLIEKIMLHNTDTATVVALNGELGAGKTNLTQEVSRLLGVKEKIISPTFVIMKNYKINKNNKFKNLIHIDAYRIDNPDEFSHFKWQDFFLNKENLILIEWPEKVAKIIPQNSIKVFLSHIDEETRKIKF
jgi:tRNA threonylcarbamoyladenosine biosynthesis protein TsaE